MSIEIKPIEVSEKDLEQLRFFQKMSSEDAFKLYINSLGIPPEVIEKMKNTKPKTSDQYNKD